jgi:hypothetical protein
MSIIIKPKKLLVCVTFHFVQERLFYLHKISSQFASMCDELQVFILTDAIHAKMDILQRLAEFNITVKVVSPTLLGHPYLLTWCHLDIFRREHIKDETITHFLYLEDDILVTEENITYWIEGRARLRKFGVIPSFLRFEVSPANGEKYSTDVTSKVDPMAIPKVVFKELGYAYFNLPQPYQGMYFLDRELMEEHLTSQSCSPDFGKWGIREKAAQGVTFLNVPKGFTSRNLIGYNVTLERIDERCLIHHITDNYIVNSNTPFSKIRIRDLFSQHITL